MSYDLMFRKANELYMDGALNQAEQLYRRILETAPENPDVLNMLGLVAEAKGLPAEAVDCFYKALKFSSHHLPLYFNLAVSLTSAGRFKEAADAYGHVLAMNDELKEAHNNLGGVYEKLGIPDKAAEEYKKALNIDENYLEAAVNLAALKKNTETLKQLSEKHPETSLPLYYLSRIERQSGNLQNANKYIKEAIEKEDATDEVFLTAGEIFLETGNRTEALNAFRNTLKLNPRCVPALVNLGTLTDNEEMLKNALNLEPDNAEARANYADLLYKQKRTLEALEEYRKAVILKPDMPQLSNNLALILKDNGEYEQALDLFLDAYFKNPQITDFSVNIAETLVLLHHQAPEQALKIAQSWAKAAPDNPFAVHTFNAFSGKDSGKTDTDYAKALFDAFAGTYNETMKNIKYGVLDKIEELGIHFIGKILDLGCGTGLAGQKFHTPKNTFTGVDISQNMLNIARLTGAYQHLFCQDITKHLKNNNLKYDLVLALDVLNYLENFNELAGLLKPTPLLFTVENAAQNIKTHILMPNGRYQYNPDYIEKLLYHGGYDKIERHVLVLRQENGLDVAGTLFFAR